MKNLLSKKNALCGLLATAIMVSSCSKTGDSSNDYGTSAKAKNVTINTTIHYGDTANVDLSSYGDADDIVSITQQATNYTYSEVVKNSAGQNVYRYAASSSTAAEYKLVGVYDSTQIKIYEPTHKGKHKGGKCSDNDNDDDYTLVTVKLTVQ